MPQNHIWPDIKYDIKLIHPKRDTSLLNEEEHDYHDNMSLPFPPSEGGIQIAPLPIPHASASAKENNLYEEHQYQPSDTPSTRPHPLVAHDPHCENFTPPPINTLIVSLAPPTHAHINVMETYQLGEASLHL